MKSKTRDDPGHPRSRYRAKYVVFRQFYEKGLGPTDAAQVLAIHVNTLKKWCENMGIPYPAEGPREFINTMTESDVAVDCFPDDVDIPDHQPSWDEEEARSREIDYDRIVDYSDGGERYSSKQSTQGENDESNDEDNDSSNKGMNIEGDQEQTGVLEW